jgi:DNA replication and repair protein RecF
MMFSLQSLTLHNFKNYEDFSVQFCPSINCIVGVNGVGKTNMLDAVHYLSLTKSAFNSQDVHSIRHGEELFVVSGKFHLAEKKHQILCGLQQGQKKTLKIDQVPYQKFTEHIGLFPVVLIAPQDHTLITEGSEERRKFFDAIISQIDQPYMLNLVQYNHYLKQRNALLKQAKERGVWDSDLLATYDALLLPLAQHIYERRKNFTENLLPAFLVHYQYLTEGAEQVHIKYESDVENSNFPRLFADNLRKDVELQRTTMGVHKDDFEFLLGDFPLKKFGSQGQQKSFLIALKLAHFGIIQAQKGIKPILLLDDIFDKLDDKRIAKLLAMVARQDFGQIILTDARPERSRQILQGIDAEKQFIELN